jgi:hypothetical protein
MMPFETGEPQRQKSGIDEILEQGEDKAITRTGDVVDKHSLALRVGSLLKMRKKHKSCLFCFTQDNPPWRSCKYYNRIEVLDHL